MLYRLDILIVPCFFSLGSFLYKKDFSIYWWQKRTKVFTFPSKQRQPQFHKTDTAATAGKGSAWSPCGAVGPGEVGQETREAPAARAGRPRDFPYSRVPDLGVSVSFHCSYFWGRETELVPYKGPSNKGCCPFPICSSPQLSPRLSPPLCPEMSVVWPVVAQPSRPPPLTWEGKCFHPPEILPKPNVCSRLCSFQAPPRPTAHGRIQSLGLMKVESYQVSLSKRTVVLTDFQAFWNTIV